MLAALAWLTGACASTPTSPPVSVAAPAPPPSPGPGPPAPGAPAPALPEVFESEDFIVTFARAGDTPESLAARYLGDAAKAWMIEDYAGTRAFVSGPGGGDPAPGRGTSPACARTATRSCRSSAITISAEQAKGRLVMAASTFREQMQYLKANGYHVISLREFVEFTRLGRQLPQRSVVLTFDDGYKSFKQYAYPVLKELGFPATLFVYTDYVGAGRNRAVVAGVARARRRRASTSRRTRRRHGDLRAHRRGARRAVPAAHAGRAGPAAGAVPEEPRPTARTSSRSPTGAGTSRSSARRSSTAMSRRFSVRRQGNGSFVRPLDGQSQSDLLRDDTR